MYPQPSADQYVTDGYSFFRLKTPLVSAGDMYESTQGGYAIAIGPQSDIASVSVAYYDTQAIALQGVETFLTTALVTPENAFVGKVDSHSEQSILYMPAKRPGRILIWPNDLYDPNYRPSGFNPVQDHLILEVPLLDVVQYFSPQASVSSTRADKTFFYQSLPFGLDDVYVLVPCYGRNYMFCEFDLGAGSGGDIDYSISGLSFNVSTTGPSITTLQASATQVAGTAPKINTFTSATEGRFDYLQFQFSPVSGSGFVTTLKVILSDTSVGA